MPILRGAVTFARYQASFAEKVDAGRVLARGLKRFAFEPLDPASEETRAAGFAELEDPEATTFSPGAVHHGNRALFTWRVDELRIPAAQLAAQMREWTRDFEREQGRRPSRNEKTARKAELRDRLRKRAFPVSRTHDVAWDLRTGELRIWSASRKVVDEVVGVLETAFGARIVPRRLDAMASEAEIDDAVLRPTPVLAGTELEGGDDVAA